MSDFNVLSLFDGISCGQVALKRLKIPYDNYFASEIDKYAIKITQKNFPNTIQVGDVSALSASTLPKIDLLIGGSPCQGFSFAGKQLNFQDSRSKLFFEYVRLLKECKPKYFLLENVKMKKEYQDIISQYLGVQPVEINSADFSAQNRVRLYWTNIPLLKKPPKTNMMLQDILEDGYVDRDKSYCIDASYFKGGNLKQYFEKSRRQLVFRDAIAWSSSGRGNGIIQDRFRVNEKSNTLMASGSGCGGSKTLNIVYSNEGIRKLTPIECERLQTLTDNYTEGISNTQRYKCLGNGWTVTVIQYILQGIINE